MNEIRNFKELCKATKKFVEKEALGIAHVKKVVLEPHLYCRGAYDFSGGEIISVRTDLANELDTTLKDIGKQEFDAKRFNKVHRGLDCLLHEYLHSLGPDNEDSMEKDELAYENTSYGEAFGEGITEMCTRLLWKKYVQKLGLVERFGQKMEKGRAESYPMEVEAIKTLLQIAGKDEAWLLLLKGEGSIVVPIRKLGRAIDTVIEGEAKSSTKGERLIKMAMSWKGLEGQACRKQLYATFAQITDRKTVRDIE